MIRVIHHDLERKCACGRIRGEGDEFNDAGQLVRTSFLNGNRNLLAFFEVQNIFLGNVGQDLDAVNVHYLHHCQAGLDCVRPRPRVACQARRQ